MGTRLFCGGLAWATDDASLRAAFESFGEITDVRVVLDRETGRSRGFGFVAFADEEGQADPDELDEDLMDDDEGFGVFTLNLLQNTAIKHENTF